MTSCQTGMYCPLSLQWMVSLCKLQGVGGVMERKNTGTFLPHEKHDSHLIKCPPWDNWWEDPVGADKPPPTFPEL